MATPDSAPPPFIKRYRVIRRVIRPRQSHVDSRRRRFFFCARAFPSTLLRFISLNARVSLVRSRGRVGFRQGRKIDTSVVSISRTWAQLRKT